ncbi:MAG: succinate dehydrogenase, cytochrome b556 subunit [Pseudomonadales bacterium]
MKNDSRPVNLDLTKFAFPIHALTSITHRIAGVALFVAVAFGLYALDRSLASETGFEQIAGLMVSPVGKLITWLILSALAFHFIAGIRHMLMDMDVAESLEGGRFGARVTFLLSSIVILVAGSWVLQW